MRFRQRLDLYYFPRCSMRPLSKLAFASKWWKICNTVATQCKVLQTFGLASVRLSHKLDGHPSYSTRLCILQVEVFRRLLFSGSQHAYCSGRKLCVLDAVILHAREVMLRLGVRRRCWVVRGKETLYSFSPARGFPSEE